MPSLLYCTAFATTSSARLQAGMPLKRKKNRINPAQIEKLESIGFEWGRVKQTAWDKTFDILKRFVSKEGHARVPPDLDTEEYPRLGEWAAVQRAVCVCGPACLGNVVVHALRAVAFRVVPTTRRWAARVRHDAR